MFDVSAETLEQGEEVSVVPEILGEWALQAQIVAPDTFQGEVEPIADSRVSAAALVDWLPHFPSTCVCTGNTR